MVPVSHKPSEMISVSLLWTELVSAALPCVIEELVPAVLLVRPPARPLPRGCRMLDGGTAPVGIEFVLRTDHVDQLP